MENDPSSLATWHSVNIGYLEKLTQMVSKGLKPIEHKSIVALITQDVHCRDIIDILANEGVQAITEF